MLVVVLASRPAASVSRLTNYAARYLVLVSDLCVSAMIKTH